MPERHALQLQQRTQQRQLTLESTQDAFICQRHQHDAAGNSIIRKDEAEDLAFWLQYQSWTYCPKCNMLEPHKLQPSFARRTATTIHARCKCGNGVYTVPSVDNVPIILRSLSLEDQRVLSPFEVHCGDYSRQRTGPFRVTWCLTLVTQKIEAIPDARRKQLLFQAYNFLIENRDSSYSRFVRLHANDHPKPFLYKIFTSPIYRGIECTLWSSLYYNTKMCKSVLEGQENRASSKISFLHKVLSPAVDYLLSFDILQYQFDR